MIDHNGNWVRDHTDDAETSLAENLSRFPTTLYRQARKGGQCSNGIEGPRCGHQMLLERTLTFPDEHE